MKDAEILCQAEDMAFPDRLARAKSRRRAEFAAGRLCAKAALSDIGVGASYPKMNSDGSPLWPYGATGSISHACGWAVAIAGSSDRYRGIGVDIEKRLSETEAREIAGGVLSQEELLALSVRDPAHIGIAFSVKEALFKALYPSAGRPINFHAFQLLKVSENGLVHLRLRADFGPLWRSGDEFSVRYRLFEDLLMTWVLIP